MDIRFHNTSGGEWTADCFILALYEGQSLEEASPTLWEKASWLSISPAFRDFKGKQDELLMLYGHPDAPVSRVLLVGLGKKAKVKGNTFRNGVAKAAKHCQDKGYASIGVLMCNFNALAEPLAMSAEALAGEAVIAAKLGLYRIETYKGKKTAKEQEEDDSSFVQWMGIFIPEASTPDSLQTTIRAAEAQADGVMLARDLANGPANIITPTIVAETAETIAKTHGFACTVLSEDRIKEMGMGAFYAVAQGAKEEAKFIILEHAPKGKGQDDPFIIVGKGITFDTGGISLKPAANMHEMKSDMAGAAGVLGFFEALGLSPEKDDFPRIIGLVPTAENMPGGNATRPGDIVTTLSGKTVEILNTDAEGRLILCDALTYAQQNWKPKALVDIATLTGACVVALGDYASGVFTEHGSLRRAVLDCAEELGELMWPLPMWDEYDKGLKSDVADFGNMGERMGGALFAALFLRRFIEEDTKWLHLDIAGPGYVVKPSPQHPVGGATGEGVRIFYALTRRI